MKTVKRIMLVLLEIVIAAVIGYFIYTGIKLRRKETVRLSAYHLYSNYARFLACAVFVFPSALGRIIEGERDFGLSLAYYFCNLFGVENSAVNVKNIIAKQLLSCHREGRALSVDLR